MYINYISYQNNSCKEYPNNIYFEFFSKQLVDYTNIQIYIKKKSNKTLNKKE